MEKLTQAQVIQRWKEGKSGSAFYTRTFWTDGTRIYSEGRLIGTTVNGLRWWLAEDPIHPLVTRRQKIQSSLVRSASQRAVRPVTRSQGAASHYGTFPRLAWTRIGDGLIGWVSVLAWVYPDYTAVTLEQNKSHAQGFKTFNPDYHIQLTDPKWATLTEIQVL